MPSYIGFFRSSDTYIKQSEMATAISNAIETVKNTILPELKTDDINETVNNVFISPAQKAALHSAVTIGTANGLSLSTQTLSLAFATTSNAGAMSSFDKSKLDGIAASANNYVHPTGDGNSHVPITSTTNNGKFLKAGATANSSSWQSIVWNDITSKPTTLTGYGITDAVSTTALSTWVGTTNITTLGTIATGTWNATAISPAKIATDASNRFVTDTQISNWNTAYTNNHTHSNKANLDTIDQSLSITSSPIFSQLTVTNELFVNTIYDKNASAYISLNNDISIYGFEAVNIGLQDGGNNRINVDMTAISLYSEYGNIYTYGLSTSINGGASNLTLEADYVSLNETLTINVSGKAPLAVSSTVKVDNLNADLLDGMHATANNTASTIVARDSSANFSANQITANTFKVNTNTNGYFGSIQASWGGSTNYPTLYGSDANRWIMHINPHICYVVSGTNGYTGGMTGATIRMASDATASPTSWDLGIGVTGIGTDKFGIGRATINLFSIDNLGNTAISGIIKAGSYAIMGTNIAGGYYQDASNGAYRALGTDGNRAYYFQTYNGVSTALYVGLVGTYAGRIGISTTTPSTTLHVGGTTTSKAISIPNMVHSSSSIDNGLIIGNSSYSTSIVHSPTTGASFEMFHNTYIYRSSTGARTYTWVNTHASFGSRGIRMDFSDGISFYADVVATTAGTTFTPTRRMLIGNDGNTTVDGYLIIGNQATSTSHAVRADRSISAGVGLSGGGDLTTNRTISMGTPSTLTDTTINNVTSTSHTHAITTYSVSGTNNRVTVTGVGKVLGQAITLSVPQDIHTAATPTFAGMTFTGASNQDTIWEGQRTLKSDSYANVFGGGWKLNNSSTHSTFEVDNLIVRGTLRATTFEYDTIKAFNGAGVFTDATYISDVSNLVAQDLSSPIYVKDPAFQVDDIVIYTSWEATNTGLSIVKFTSRITSAAQNADPKKGYLYWISTDIVDTIGFSNLTTSLGASILRVGNKNNINRRGMIYYNTASSQPFISIMNDNGTSHTNNINNFDARTKVRLGYLDGLNGGTGIGTMSGYGLYADNVYLKGTVVANSGLIGGLDISSTSISKIVSSTKNTLTRNTRYFKVGDYTTSAVEESHYTLVDVMDQIIPGDWTTTITTDFSNEFGMYYRTISSTEKQLWLHGTGSYNVLYHPYSGTNWASACWTFSTGDIGYYEELTIPISLTSLKGKWISLTFSIEYGYNFPSSYPDILQPTSNSTYGDGIGIILPGRSEFRLPKAPTNSNAITYNMATIGDNGYWYVAGDSSELKIRIYLPNTNGNQKSLSPVMIKNIKLYTLDGNPHFEATPDVFRAYNYGGREGIFFENGQVRVKTRKFELTEFDIYEETDSSGNIQLKAKNKRTNNITTIAN